MSPSLAALVPIKSFADGKSRLEPALADHERAALAEKLAASVVQACAPIPVYVACESDDVATWAQAQGAATIRGVAVGLNRVVQHGVAVLAAKGYERVLIAHGDLADPRNLAGLANWDGIVLVPDRRLKGTNVLIIPPDIGFRFSYGPGSFARHLSEAERIDLPLHVIDDPGLALDLDEPDDLDAYVAAQATDVEPPTARER
ncbi:MAG: 2-phospho-L-lactate guanylyltransferase [Acidimicrobiales bacterium]